MELPLSALAFDNDTCRLIDINGEDITFIIHADTKADSTILPDFINADHIARKSCPGNLQCLTLRDRPNDLLCCLTLSCLPLCCGWLSKQDKTSEQQATDDRHKLAGHCAYRA